MRQRKLTSPTLDLDKDWSRILEPNWGPDDLIARSRVVKPGEPDGPLTLLATYLPQFHTIPENDSWWEPGFTEWTKVRSANPLYKHHYQPHVPLPDVGYYDLSDIEVMRRQGEMARDFGLSGFLVYDYDFGCGKRLLQKPIESLMARPDISFPFALCWANESWTRTWDGNEKDVLIQQVHSREQDSAYIRRVLNLMQDPRYVTVNNRHPIFVYRPELLHSPQETLEEWRRVAKLSGISLLILGGQGFTSEDPTQWGFDGAFEFPPLNMASPRLSRPDGFAGAIYDWRWFVERAEAFRASDFPLVRSTTLHWDNSARRGVTGTIFEGASPHLFRHWLTLCAREALQAPEAIRGLVLINAWNEWAEGCHLEPDERFGYQWLNAVHDVQMLALRAALEKA